MKQLKEILEGVFDKDLIEKSPIDWSWFKTKDPEIKSNIFLIIHSFMHTPNPEKDLPEWMYETYLEHQIGFDYIIQSLQKCFNKQNFDTWVEIDGSEFEEIGDGMDEDEIDYRTDELDKYFAGCFCNERGAHFKVGRGRIPKIIVWILKSLGYPVTKFNSITDWGLEYYNSGEQILVFYGCPRGLDPVVKKLLYE